MTHMGLSAADIRGCQVTKESAFRRPTEMGNLSSINNRYEIIMCCGIRCMAWRCLLPTYGNVVCRREGMSFANTWESRLKKKNRRCAGLCRQMAFIPVGDANYFK